MSNKPSDQAKQLGLKSLAQVCKLCNKPQDTLIRWHKENPELFKIVLQGCAVECNEFVLKKDVIALIEGYEPSH
jgi:hypothetical protein